MAGRETEKIILVLVVAVVLILVVGAFFSMMGGYGWGGMMGPMMGGGYGMMGYGGMLVGPVIGILFVILIVVGIYYLFTGRGFSESEKKTALDILKERYAKGEITEEQYKKMKQELA